VQVVSTIEMADHVKERDNSMKGKNMSESARHSFDANFKIMMI
jgi:hypothetical protein